MNPNRKVVGTVSRFVETWPRLACIVLAAAFLYGSAAGQVGPLTLGDLIVGLRAPGATIAAKNTKLTADVKKRGVDFPLLPEIEAVLRQEKANDVLIAAIRGSKGSGAVSALKPGTLRKSPTGIELVWIPPGEFMMGSSEDEIDQMWAECRKEEPTCQRDSFEAEAPKHKVTIGEGFWLGRYEVTQGEWRSVMGSNPSYFKNCGLRCPVETVNWDDIQMFLRRLNARDAEFEYRLPSEAEWEYSARAGTVTAFAFGNSLSSTQANFDGNVERPVRVGSYQPNAWGLYDMHGNVWERVEDIYNEKGYVGLSADGRANVTIGDASVRVVRGGSWIGGARIARSAGRGGPWWSSSEPDYSIGFRLLARPR